MLSSWITLPENSHFPLQNLPFGLAKVGSQTHAVSRIGDTLVSLRALEALGYLEGLGVSEPLFQGLTLNTFMAAGPSVRRSVRERLIDIFRPKTAAQNR